MLRHLCLYCALPHTDELQVAAGCMECRRCGGKEFQHLGDPKPPCPAALDIWPAQALWFSQNLVLGFFWDRLPVFRRPMQWCGMDYATRENWPALELNELKIERQGYNAPTHNVRDHIWHRQEVGND